MVLAIEDDDYKPDPLAGRLCPDEHDKRAPWRARLADGSLGEDFYPIGRSGEEISHDRAAREWLERRAGGSLWDHDEEARYGVRRRKGQAVRTDRGVMLAFLEARGHELGARQVEIGLLFFRDYLSYSTIAARTGLARKTVDNVVQTLRQKARGR